MDILFPRIDFKYEFSNNSCYNWPKKSLGNPRAIAAQTYKSKKVGIELFNLDPWVKFSHLFTSQYLIEKDKAPTIPIPNGNDWIIYPYALGKITGKLGCLVWREQFKPRWIRHLRVYRDETYALNDNHLITQSIRRSRVELVKVI